MNDASHANQLQKGDDQEKRKLEKNRKEKKHTEHECKKDVPRERR